MPTAENVRRFLAKRGVKATVVAYGEDFLIRSDSDPMSIATIWASTAEPGSLHIYRATVWQRLKARLGRLLKWDFS